MYKIAPNDWLMLSKKTITNTITDTKTYMRRCSHTYVLISAKTLAYGGQKEGRASLSHGSDCI